MSKVRPNIEIGDDYVQEIMDRYGVRTKTEAVELALRHLAGQPIDRDESLAGHARKPEKTRCDDCCCASSCCTSTQSPISMPP